MSKPSGHKRSPQKQASAKSAPSSTETGAGPDQASMVKWSGWILLGITALVFLQARIKLLAIPLERDEGVFAYMGHWMLRGRELYTQMIDSKLPGLYAYYGLFTSLFGFNATGVHMGLLVANVVSAVALYYFARSMYNHLVAAIATSFFLFMVISPSMVGFAAHATQLLTPFLMLGILLFWNALRSGKKVTFLVAGLMIGIAFTIKQQAAIFGILLAIMWWPARLRWYKKPEGRLPILEWMLLGIGGLLPLACIVTYYGAVGHLDELYNWTVTQPFSLAGSYRDPKIKLFLNILPQVIDHFEAVWLLATAGLVFVFMSGYKRESAWFAVSCGILGVLSVIIGAAYYPHYFVLAIPGIAILAACALYWLSLKINKYGTVAAITIAAILLILSIRGHSDYFFRPNYAKIHFETYNRNMFPEMELIGKELGRRVPEGERIGILGSEPEILVAANRESCSRYLMIYAILTNPVLSPPMQEEFVQNIKDCYPEYIVFNPLSSSWAPGYDKLQFFLDFMPWVEEHYTAVGMAESFEDRPGVIVWDEALKNHRAQSNYQIIVLQRKDKIPPPPAEPVMPPPGSFIDIKPM